MSAFLLTPATKQTIWGGKRLKRDFNTESGYDSVAEAWSLSCHPDGESVVASGEYKGEKLSSVINKLGRKCLGAHCENIEDFPILIKLIDAADKLSVQVHPDDEYAKAHEKETHGKTEAWYIIDCDEGAELIYGFKENITKEQFENSIKDSTLLDYVNRVKVKPGDVALIEAGTLHAIGAGILLAEVQQSCNTTYRVYDYNRPGLDGKPRQLHIKQSIDVTKCEKPSRSLNPEGEKKIFDGYSSRLLCSCKFFNMTDIEVTKSYTDNADEASFVSLLILDGNGELVSSGEKLKITKGSSVFVPAGDGEFTVNGNVKILLTRV